jgi:uncharacterized iron-regulated membrane protein
MSDPSQPVVSTGRPLPELAARRRSLFWRVHFWAALIASPFTLLATLTGIVYILTPQVEGRLHGKLDHVAPAGAMLALDTAVAAARAAAPAGWSLQSVQPPHAAGNSVKVVFAPGVKSSGGHEGHSAAASPSATRQDGPPLAIFVNPYDGHVLGAQVEQERFRFWARRLHSQLLQGDGWRWLIELAAGWLMVMLLTGIYLLAKCGAARTAATRQAGPGAVAAMACLPWRGAQCADPDDGRHRDHVEQIRR